MTKVLPAQHLPSTCKGGCSHPIPGSDVTICPESKSMGRGIELVTVKALLKASSLRRLDGANYYFCPAPDCDVVYFDSTASSCFRKTELLVRVGQKESEDPIPVCYCFEFTLEDLRRDLTSLGDTDIPERITEEIRAGHCACEVKNPEGTCCLGNVRDAVKRIRSEITRETQGPPTNTTK